MQEDIKAFPARYLWLLPDDELSDYFFPNEENHTIDNETPKAGTKQHKTYYVALIFSKGYDNEGSYYWAKKNGSKK